MGISKGERDKRTKSITEKSITDDMINRWKA
jgi:hypothetical protein